MSSETKKPRTLSIGKFMPEKQNKHQTSCSIINVLLNVWKIYQSTVCETYCVSFEINTSVKMSLPNYNVQPFSRALIWQKGVSGAKRLAWTNRKHSNFCCSNICTWRLAGFNFRIEITQLRSVSCSRTNWVWMTSVEEPAVCLFVCCFCLLFRDQKR